MVRIAHQVAWEVLELAHYSCQLIMTGSSDSAYLVETSGYCILYSRSYYYLLRLHPAREDSIDACTVIVPCGSTWTDTEVPLSY
jgi:hypothetical protein